MKTVRLLAAGAIVGLLAILAFRPSGESLPVLAPTTTSGGGALPLLPGDASPSVGADASPVQTADPPAPRPSVAARGGAVTRMLAEREAARKHRGEDAVITPEELAGRAARVEFEANRRLEQWTRELKLSEQQQNRAFAILARASDAYHPALEVEGESVEGDSGDAVTVEVAGGVPGEPVSAPRPVEGELQAILDPEQQDQLEDELADRSLWWDDVVSYLEADLDASTAAAAAAAEPVAEPSDYEGDDLSDLFGN